MIPPKPSGRGKVRRAGAATFLVGAEEALCSDLRVRHERVLVISDKRTGSSLPYTYWLKVLLVNPHYQKLTGRIGA